MLYIYDQAAWHGADDIRAHFPSLLNEAVGYVVTGDESHAELVFFDGPKSRAVYRAAVANGRILKSGPASPDRVELTQLERRMIDAKDKALAAFKEANVGVCAEAIPNLAALPPDTPGGPIIVYLMTPQINPNTFPLGGHYSVEVHSDGSTGQVRRFTNSCVDMPRNQRPEGEPAPFVITHLLDPTPTEIHVFTSLASNVPLVVLTHPRGRMWVVDGNSVRSVAMPSKK